jgi:hypothetical protein
MPARGLGFSVRAAAAGGGPGNGEGKKKSLAAFENGTLSDILTAESGRTPKRPSFVFLFCAGHLSIFFHIGRLYPPYRPFVIEAAPPPLVPCRPLFLISSKLSSINPPKISNPNSILSAAVIIDSNLSPTIVRATLAPPPPLSFATVSSPPPPSLLCCVSKSELASATSSSEFERKGSRGPLYAGRVAQESYRIRNTPAKICYSQKQGFFFLSFFFSVEICC